MLTLQDAALRSVHVFAQRIETELVKADPDHNVIHNASLHVRTGLLHLGVSQDDLPDQAQGLATLARQRLEGVFPEER